MSCHLVSVRREWPEDHEVSMKLVQNLGFDLTGLEIVGRCQPSKNSKQESR